MRTIARHVSAFVFVATIGVYISCNQRNESQSFESATIKRTFRFEMRVACHPTLDGEIAALAAQSRSNVVVVDRKRIAKWYPTHSLFDGEFRDDIVRRTVKNQDEVLLLIDAFDIVDDDIGMATVNGRTVKIDIENNFPKIQLFYNLNRWDEHVGNGNRRVAVVLENRIAKTVRIMGPKSDDEYISFDWRTSDAAATFAKVINDGSSPDEE